MTVLESDTAIAIGAAARRPDGRRQFGHWVLLAPAGLFIGVLVVCALAMLRLSFGSKAGEWTDWTLGNYPALDQRQTWDMLVGADADIGRLGESIGTSLMIAGIAAGLSALCGIPASYALSRYRFAGKAVVEQMISLPIVFPAVVLGVALLVIVSRLGVDLGPFQIALAHVIVLLPFMIRNCMAALDGLDPALEEAARTLGASPLRAFFGIVLPLMRSGILSGFLLVFILSLNEFTLAYFLFTINSFPLSMWLFQASSSNLNPSVFAVSTLVIIINVALILAVDRVRGAKGVAL